jgi:hypothetical protein
LSPDIAEKLRLNDVAEMVGVDELVELEPVELDELDELLEELPHATMAMLTANTPNAPSIGRNFKIAPSSGWNA